ncbi:uncharacterized protein PAC_09976 [Phialocephala subalpina]|uniref:Uncharacterized protein n=1 Tax=Phialocephala subalpina TaxID=576137 RepID=A0A1L7X4Y2_9HELO|nr:uncharacterized protein PAC_09976 [Phialocephala subalpina]
MIKQLCLATCEPELEKTFDHIFSFPSDNVQFKVKYQGKNVTGNVVSQVMVLTSTVWNKILFPPWVSESSSPTTTMKEIDFSEDDGDAILILLQIIHLRFCDDWMAVKRSGLDRPTTRFKWLYIAWAFGSIEIFTSLTKEMVLEGVNPSADSREFNFNQFKCLHIPSGVVVPDKIVEMILIVRAEAIEQLLEIFHAVVKKY